MRPSAGRQIKWGICTNPNCPNYRQKIPIERGDLICPNEECKKPLSPCAPPPVKKNFFQKWGKQILTTLAVIGILGGGGYFGFHSWQKSQQRKAAELAMLDSLRQDSIEKARLEAIARAEADSAAQVQAIADSIEKARLDSIEKARLDSLRLDSIEKARLDSLRLDSIEKAKADSIAKSKKRTGGATGTKNLGFGTYKGEMKNGQPHGMGTLTFSTSHVIDSRDAKGRVAEKGDYVSGLFYAGHVETAKWFGADGRMKGVLNLGRP